MRVPAGASGRAPTRTARLLAPAGGALLCALLAYLLAGPPAQAARAEPAWTTYHRDPARSGHDPDAAEPIVPTFAWQSPNLDAPIWGQPLVLGVRVYVATVGDQIYALEASTGDVLWSKTLGTPVPSGKLPCGDITPTVGIVGTPVIDTSKQVIYAVADTWNQREERAEHVLKGLNLATGEQVLSKPVDPPGSDPKALLQRTALNLDEGEIVFGFGGNDGDCSDYRGAVVAAPETGGSPLYWQVPIAAPSTSGGAVWATSGPAVDSKTYDYSDSVLELGSSLNLLGSFQPPTWLTDSNSDTDLGSAGAELLPGGLLFQAGKGGVGYLIEEASMNTGAAALYSHEVCAGQGSFGGDAYASAVIYIPCTNGVQALAYDQTARTFTPLWQGPSDAFGPPIISGGLVWSLATGGFTGGGSKLYGIDPSTGEARYTETLPSPVADHFASPSAAGGRLFVATGSSVSAYQIGQLSSRETTETPHDNPGGSGATTTPTATPTGTPAATVSKPPALLPAPLLLAHTRLHASGNGRVRLRLWCAIRSGSCKGTVTLRAKFPVSGGEGGQRVRRTLLITLARARFGAAKGAFTVTLQLDASAEAHLHLHHDRLALQVTIASPGSRAREVAAVLTQSG